MYQLLIVDDEEDIRRGMARGIPWENWGFAVCGLAKDGEEAVKFVEQKRPNVVLSDIRMPKMDGIELMQYLHENHPEVKIIILSGYNDTEYLNMAIKNQVTEYLLKPTDIDEFEALFCRIKENLDEEQMKRQELESLKLSAKENQELSYARVLSNMLDGYVGDSREYGWKAEMEEQGMTFCSCVLVVFDTGQDDKAGGDGHYSQKQRIIAYCNTRQTAWAKRFFLYRGMKIIGVISVPAGESVDAQISQCVREIQAEIGDIYGVSLLAGVSPVCTDEKLLPSYYDMTIKTASSPALDLPANSKKSSLLVESIREYVDREYSSNLISLDSVAEQFRKNPAYISKVFKKETGFNFSDYITQKRMARGKQLLKDMSLKIYEIAEMTGYADTSNFIKVFKKHCGMSPNEYRSLY